MNKLMDITVIYRYPTTALQSNISHNENDKNRMHMYHLDLDYIKVCKTTSMSLLIVAAGGHSRFICYSGLYKFVVIIFNDTMLMLIITVLILLLVQFLCFLYKLRLKVKLALSCKHQHTVIL